MDNEFKIVDKYNFKIKIYQGISNIYILYNCKRLPSKKKRNNYQMQMWAS